MRLLTPTQAAIEWASIRKWIDEANSYGGGKLTPEDYLVKVLTGQSDVWVADDMCAIAEASQFPRRRVYQIMLAGGNGGHNWADIERELENMALARGCDCIEVYGRPGWKRILTEAGYEIPLWLYSKDIGGSTS